MESVGFPAAPGGLHYDDAWILAVVIISFFSLFACETFWFQSIPRLAHSGT